MSEQFSNNLNLDLIIHPELRKFYIYIILIYNTMIKALYLISLILLQASSIKIFLLGGATADNET